MIFASAFVVLLGILSLGPQPGLAQSPSCVVHIDALFTSIAINGTTQTAALPVASLRGACYASENVTGHICLNDIDVLPLTSPFFTFSLVSINEDCPVPNYCCIANVGLNPLLNAITLAL